jgi:hypothetical protein
MINVGDAMKSLEKNKASDAKSIKADRKRLDAGLSARQLQRVREALVNPAVEEPGGVLAGASFRFP